MFHFSAQYFETPRQVAAVDADQPETRNFEHLLVKSRYLRLWPVLVRQHPEVEETLDQLCFRANELVT